MYSPHATHRASRSDIEISLVALGVARYDLVALIEVRTDAVGVQRMKEILAADFGLAFDYFVSEPVRCLLCVGSSVGCWGTKKIVKIHSSTKLIHFRTHPAMCADWHGAREIRIYMAQRSCQHGSGRLHFR